MKHKISVLGHYQITIHNTHSQNSSVLHYNHKRSSYNILILSNIIFLYACNHVHDTKNNCKKIDFFYNNKNTKTVYKIYKKYMILK